MQSRGIGLTARISVIRQPGQVLPSGRRRKIRQSLPGARGRLLLRVVVKHAPMACYFVRRRMTRTSVLAPPPAFSYPCRHWPMNNPIRFKLFLMMVLELFIWGAWLPLIFGYLPSLGFTPGEQSWILNAFPIAAIVGMFFSTQFADRHFSAEKFMAFSHLVGGAAILGLAFTR